MNQDIEFKIHSAGKYNEQAFQALDYILDEASKVGVRVLLTLSDNWAPTDSKEQVGVSRLDSLQDNALCRSWACTMHAGL